LITGKFSARTGKFATFPPKNGRWFNPRRIIGRMVSKRRGRIFDWRRERNWVRTFSTVGVVLLCRNETFYVLDVVRGKFPFDQLKRKIIELKRSYGASTLLIEESPISHGLIQSLQESRINVVTVRPDRDKRSRLISQIDLFEGGSVFFSGKSPLA
jgi:predicted phage terminase large subunit-like protein